MMIVLFVNRFIALTGLLVSIRLDRLDNQRLGWSSSYTDPSSPDYQQLQWEANKAVIILRNIIQRNRSTNHFQIADKFVNGDGTSIISFCDVVSQQVLCYWQ